MFKYILKAILKRRSRNVLLLVGLLALSSGLSTYVSANQNAKVRVDTALDEHWRGAYDILVRPQDAVQPTEQKYGLVEANYLSVGKSGISVQQWKQIEQLSGIEVAAPVATVGYLRNVSGVMQAIMPPRQEEWFYRFNVVISSTNGYRSTTLANTNEYLLFDPTLASSTPPATRTEGQDPVVLVTSSTGGDVGYNPEGEVVAYISNLPAFWTLVAGIDPAAERRLVGLDQALDNGDYLADNDGFTTEKLEDPSKNQDKYKNKDGRLDRERYNRDLLNYRTSPDGPNIPIMFAASSYISVPVTVRIDDLQIPDSEVVKNIKAGIKQEIIQGDFDNGKMTPTDRLRQTLDALNSPVKQEVADISFDFGSILKPMSKRTVNVSLYSGEQPVQADPNYKKYDAGDMQKTYLPGPISYVSQSAPFDTNGRLSLAVVPKSEAQAIITGTGEVAFRSLALAPPAMAPPSASSDTRPDRPPFPFSIKEVGSYELNKLPDPIKNPDPLTYVPLGIYQPPVVKLIRDADGNPLPQGPVTLNPTLNPASFIPGPPLALTNIASARFFRGENSIDAIRVRVAGIDRYTPENVRKVEDVAARIIAATGLRVDVVAGSSPQKVLVYIPGSPDGKIAPLGYVEEEWTTLGAAATITSGVDRASVLMLGATGLAGLLYLISQSLLSTLARRKELALLQAVGWRRRHVSSLVIGEAGIVGLLGGLCAVALAMLIAQGLGLAAPPEQALGVGAVVFLLYVLAAIGPALWVTRQPIAELLQRGEVTLPLRTSPTKRVRERLLGGTGWRGLAAIAWRNLTRRRLRAILAASGIAIATALLMLLAASGVALGGTLRVTLLGQFVGLEVQPYHFIMVGSALIISVLTVADHLAVGVLERKHELALLQAIGWRAGAVRMSLLLEGVWLGLLGGLAGTLVAVGVGLASRSELLWSAWWVAPISLAVMLGLCCLSALYAIMITPRHALVKAMQQ